MANFSQTGSGLENIKLTKHSKQLQHLQGREERENIYFKTDVELVYPLLTAVISYISNECAVIDTI